MRSAGSSARDVAQVLRILEGEDAGERDIVAELDGSHRQIAAAGEAMQHGREGALPAFLFQNPRHVGVASRAWITSGRPVSRAAAMCWRKPLRLRVARGVVVVIVEAGLADRHDFRMLARCAISALASMSSSSCALCGWVPTEQKTSGNFSATASTCACLLHARRDRHHAPDAGGARARHHGVELGGEIGKIQVAVAVDQHRQAFASGST